MPNLAACVFAVSRHCARGLRCRTSAGVTVWPSCARGDCNVLPLLVLLKIRCTRGLRCLTSETCFTGTLREEGLSCLTSAGVDDPGGLRCITFAGITVCPRCTRRDCDVWLRLDGWYYFLITLHEGGYDVSPRKGALREAGLPRLPSAGIAAEGGLRHFTFKYICALPSLSSASLHQLSAHGLHFD